MKEKQKVFVGKVSQKMMKDGRPFLAGKLGFNGLLLFPDKNDPTKYNVYITEQESKEERDARKMNQNPDGIPF